MRTFRKISHVFRGKVDFITAGFPCQPFSTAGHLKGTNDSRWLWGSILEIIGQVRPSYLFLENVSNIINQFGAFDEITKSLSKIGFNCEWSTLRASDVGANHHRNRAFIFAYIPDRLQFIEPIHPHTNMQRRHKLDNAAEPIETCRQSDKSYSSTGNDANSDQIRRGEKFHTLRRGQFDLERGYNDANSNSCKKANGGKYEVNEKTSFERQNVKARSQNISGERRFQKAWCIERNATHTSSNRPRKRANRITMAESSNRPKEIWINSPEWWQNEPSMGRVVDGVAFGMDRIRACGNGVVPLQAAIAYYGLIKRAKKIMEVK